MEKVAEFSTGKHNWNTFEIGVEDGRIVVKDESGHIEFGDEAVDELVNGIDQARRRLREKAREPTEAKGS